MRLAVDMAWAWRLMKRPSPLQAQIKAFVVALIPMLCWASVLQWGVAWHFTEAPKIWTWAHASAWDTALQDTMAAAPMAFTWVGEGPPLPTLEG